MSTRSPSAFGADVAVNDRRYAQRAAHLTGSLIDASTGILAGYDHDIVRFAMGSPAADAIPSALLSELAAAQLTDPATFDYAATEGDPKLRHELRRLLARDGREVADERILITTGGMQGLDLACKLFVDPGDLVVVEGPTYTNGSATIASYQGKLLEVPIDGQGMSIDALKAKVDAAGRTPRLIYTVPTFQNPSGTSLSLARREQLIDLAARWDATIIEDDPYGTIRFTGRRLPSLIELADHPDRVVRVETFSKIIAPGLRVGWIEADPQTIALMVNAKQAMDTCTNLPAQRLIAGFLAGDHLDGHIDRLCTVYRARRDAMRSSLTTAFPAGSITITEPEGGMFLWLELPVEIDCAKLMKQALTMGVAYIPGSAFSVAGHFRNALRLCFATNSPERIDVGIRRLRAVVDAAYPGLLTAA